MTNTLGTSGWGKKKLMHIIWFEVDVTAWQAVLIKALEFCKWMLSVFFYCWHSVENSVYDFKWIIMTIQQWRKTRHYFMFPACTSASLCSFVWQPYSTNRINLVFVSTLIIFWWHGLTNVNIYFKDCIWRASELLDD